MVRGGGPLWKTALLLRSYDTKQVLSWYRNVCLYILLYTCLRCPLTFSHVKDIRLVFPQALLAVCLCVLDYLCCRGFGAQVNVSRSLGLCSWISKQIGSLRKPCNLSAAGVCGPVLDQHYDWRQPHQHNAWLNKDQWVTSEWVTLTLCCRCNRISSSW